MLQPYSENFNQITVKNTVTVTDGGVLGPDGIDLVTGNDSQINNVSALNATTLGGAVVASSLTSVGALNAGSITSGFTSIDVGAGAITTTGTLSGGTIASSGRTLGYKGDPVASTNDMTLSLGNYFLISGTTTTNRILKTGWTQGSVVILKFNGAVTVTHGVAAGSDYQGFQLAGAEDFTTGADDTLTLVFDGVWWRETSRTVI